MDRTIDQFIKQIWPRATVFVTLSHMSLGLKRGMVRLKSYDPQWSELFLEEKQLIEEVFREKVIGIEHIGSTAIPGMAAKPILDLMIAVKSIENFEELTPVVERLGYKFMRDNRDTQEHVLYVKGLEAKRTHYLKLTTTETEFWKNNILFRDYLIEHPSSVEQYNALKYSLSEKYEGVREKYTEDKESFIKKIIKLAKKEF